MSTVPKSRISRSKRGMRRSHLRIRHYTLNTCPNCKSAVLPHKICLACGWYKGRQVVISKEAGS